MMPPAVNKVTPVLVVDAVEPCAVFWESLGFVRTAQVPHGDSLGFVVLAEGTLELMYQSRESVVADDAAMGEVVRSGGGSLYVEVGNLDACVAAVAGAPVVVAERTTFYGMREVGVLDPGGNMVLLAERAT